VTNVASSRSFFVAILICISSLGIMLQAQDNASSQQDPLQRPRPVRKPDKTKAEKAYSKWLDEVSAIILPEERDAFRKLRTDTERESFVELFWQHRDPTPDTEENEYKEEFYRRKAYADDHFAAGIPGSKTDRGLMYILHGAPDSIEQHPAGGPYQRTAEEGGGTGIGYPFEIWRYRHLDGIGQEIEVEFVDSCNCGEYQMTVDRGKKEISSHIPGAAPTDMEAFGLAKQSDRFRGGLETLGPSLFGKNSASEQFERLERSVKLYIPPPVERAGMGDFEIVKTRLRANPLFFDVRVDFVKADSTTVLAPITIQIANSDLGHAGKNGLQHAALNLYGRLTTLSGKITNTFEEPLRLDVPAELLERFSARQTVYQEILPVKPGRYRLDLIVKDVNSGKVGVFSRSVTVPNLTEDKLAASTLIPADIMEPVSPSEIGAGSFILGIDKVRPRVPRANGDPAIFTRDQRVNLWMQVYHLALDTKTGKPSATVAYSLTNATTGAPVLEFSENTDQMGNVGSQITLRKNLQAGALAPGVYQVTVKVNDLVAHDSIAPTTRFAVK
jgi:GWxTD domain-containing protein